MLFLCLCHVDSKGCHEATTHNCDSTGKKHDIFLYKLILALGLLRSISCSFAYVLFCCNKGPPYTFDAYRGPHSLWRSFGRVLSGGGITPCSSCICVM